MEGLLSPCIVTWGRTSPTHEKLCNHLRLLREFATQAEMFENVFFFPQPCISQMSMDKFRSGTTPENVMNYHQKNRGNCFVPPPSQRDAISLKSSRGKRKKGTQCNKDKSLFWFPQPLSPLGTNLCSLYAAVSWPSGLSDGLCFLFTSLSNLFCKPEIKPAQL